MALAKINDEFSTGERYVITCRTEPYRQSVRPPGRTSITPRGAAGIELRPLLAADVANYLRGQDSGATEEKRWEPVIASLRTAIPLAAVLETPLMVRLVRVIYNPRSGDHVGTVPDPTRLCGFSQGKDIEDHLLNALIPAAYRPTGR